MMTTTAAATTSSAPPPLSTTLDEFQIDIWNGCIPIEVQLDEAEVGSLIPPEPVVLLASRMGYLPNILRAVVDHFQSLAVDFSSEAWFEANGIHLKR